MPVCCSVRGRETGWLGAGHKGGWGEVESSLGVGQAASRCSVSGKGGLCMQRGMVLAAAHGVPSARPPPTLAMCHDAQKPITRVHFCKVAPCLPKPPAPSPHCVPADNQPQLARSGACVRARGAGAADGGGQPVPPPVDA